jgi:hypothetical protein
MPQPKCRKSLAGESIGGQKVAAKEFDLILRFAGSCHAQDERGENEELQDEQFERT